MLVVLAVEFIQLASNAIGFFKVKYRGFEGMVIPLRNVDGITIPKLIKKNSIVPALV